MTRSLLALLALSCAAPALAAAPPPSPAAAKLASSLAQRAATAPESRAVVWVRFTDRAGAERDPRSLEAARAALPARTLDRRTRRGAFHGADASDLPVHAPYVRALVERGARLRGTSRWLNAASVEIPARLAGEFARLPFVADVREVPVGASAIRARRDAIETPEPAEATALRGTPAPEAIALAPGESAYYGGALRQLDLMQATALHAQGFSGAGVLVCMLDAGFRTTHRAFQGLDVVATRDFVHRDANVDDEAGDAPGAHSHGTMTLGCVAGSLPGTYSGGAFGASVALGKTEDIGSETPAEMDYWQFGAEWADSLGADVISSSLGYFQFDSPYPSYTYADMDGRTTVVTLAAVEAMRRGITVLNSAGNEGSTAWHYVIGPADADTVIAVGAVDSFNVVASFSSHGPTADGRTKPDVVAMGRRVLCVSPNDDSTYVRVNGTSFSCPLTAGVAALLLEAHPTWRPVDVRDALRETALNAATPDNDIGWGLVQALAASVWQGTTAVGTPPIGAARLALAASPNPAVAGERVAIRLALPRAAHVRVDALDLAGRRVARVHEGPADGARAIAWSARGDDGSPLAPGVYWLRLAARYDGGGEATALARCVVVR